MFYLILFCIVTDCCPKIEITSTGPANDSKTGQHKRLGFYNRIDELHNDRVAYLRMYPFNGSTKRDYLIFSKLQQWEVIL